MKKTLQSVALIGIITACALISSVRPSHTLQYCSVLNGTPCSVTNPDYTKPCITPVFNGPPCQENAEFCVNSYPGAEGACNCITGEWYCVY